MVLRQSNKGSVEHLGGDKWRLRVRWVDEAGERQGRSRNVVATSKRSAEGLLPGFRAQIENELTVNLRNDVSLIELIDRYVSGTKRDRRPKSQQTTETNVNRHIRAHPIAERPVVDLRTSDIEEHYELLMSSEARPLSPSTIRHIHFIVRPALDLALRDDIIVVNRADKVRLPRKHPSPVSAPSRDEVDAVLRIIDRSSPLWLFVDLALATGARRGELAALRWSSIKRDSSGVATISINHSATIAHGDDGKSRVFIDATKTGKERVVGLTRSSVDKLDEWAATKRTIRADGFVFDIDDEGGGPRDPSSFSSEWRRACSDAGVNIRLHDLRHFVASVMFEQQSTSVIEASNQLGHSKTSTTTDLYAHLLGGSERSVAIAENIQEGLGLSELT